MSPEDEEITTKLENIEQIVNFIIIERNHLRTALLNISAERDQLRARVAELTDERDIFKRTLDKRDAELFEESRRVAELEIALEESSDEQ